MLSELKKRWVTVRSKNFQLCVLHNNGLVAVPENLPHFIMVSYSVSCALAPSTMTVFVGDR